MLDVIRFLAVFCLVNCIGYTSIISILLWRELHLLMFFLFYFYRHDCGFFMFQFMQSWDGESVAKFGNEHIGYIRKAMLYSWMTSSYCCLDLTSLLIFKEGYYFFLFLRTTFFY